MAKAKRERRSSFRTMQSGDDVLSRLDAVGGDLNAYTSRERTSVHASFRQVHFARAFELLADIFMNPSFPQKELEREKQVVLEEIRMYQDEHDESILDDFESLVYRDKPLGRPILGSEATVRIGTPMMLSTPIPCALSVSANPLLGPQRNPGISPANIG